jgi:hypothetical protein
MFDRYARQLGVAAPRPKRLALQIEREGLRLLASLERLPASRRTQVGDHLAARLARAPDDAAFLWALGRAGGRKPSYGPANTVVPPADAARWVRALLEAGAAGPDRIAAVVRLCVCTGDAARDLDDAVRLDAAGWLERAGADAHAVARVREPVSDVPEDTVTAFGETLPEGLRLAAPVGGATAIP